MTLRPIAAAAALVLVPATALLPAHAQSPRDGAWRGSVSFGANFSAGNTESSSVNLGAEGVRLRSDDKLTLRATALRGEAKDGGVDRKTAELVKLGARYDRDLSPEYFAFGGVEAEHDGLQALDVRGSMNAGLGWHVIADKQSTLDLRAGLGYTHERFETRRRDVAELVLGEEYSRTLRPGTTFKQRLTAYPSLTDGGEYRAEFETTLASEIAAGWTANVSLTVRHLSDPQPGFDKTDTLLLVGVASTFGPD